MDSNEWKVGAAKRRFSEVLRRTEDAPQLIYRREKLVAAVISVDDFEETLGLRPSIAERFAEVRELMRKEKYRLPSSTRRMRSNDSVSRLDDVAG